MLPYLSHDEIKAVIQEDPSFMKSIRKYLESRPENIKTLQMYTNDGEILYQKVTDSEKIEAMLHRLETYEIQCCPICLDNNTEGMKFYACCGKPVHVQCFNKCRGAEATHVCPLCRRKTALKDVPSRLDRVYINLPSSL